VVCIDPPNSQLFAHVLLLLLVTAAGIDLGNAFSTSASSGQGASLLHAAVSSDGGGLFPCLSLCRDEQLEVNFGQKPFVYTPPRRILAPPEGVSGHPRRFRAVAALIPSPLALDALPLHVAPSAPSGSLCGSCAPAVKCTIDERVVSPAWLVHSPPPSLPSFPCSASPESD
jgi:hypothetical protein